MKKSRFVKVITIVLILLATLVGCEKDKSIEEKPIDISHTKEHVTVYTEKPCTLNITIEIKNGKNIDTVTRKFVFEGDRRRNLSIDNFAEETYNPDAMIVGASYEEVKYTYEELHDIASVSTFLIGTLLAIATIIFIKIYDKKSKSTKNS